MVKKLVVMSGLVLSGLAGGLLLHAQEPSTVVLKSGERISCELIDMNASGFAVRVNGRDRSIGVGDVSAVEFAVGPIPADAQNRINAGQPVVVMKNGPVLEGRQPLVGLLLLLAVRVVERRDGALQVRRDALGHGCCLVRAARARE